jgi:biotin operon repressor
VKISSCKNCGAVLNKDTIALNKKLLDKNLKEFKCLECLADMFDCSVEDLQDKIEEFKEEGCTLFK